MVNSTHKQICDARESTTVEIYMVNSTINGEAHLITIYNSRNLYGQFDRYKQQMHLIYLQQ